MPNPTGVNQLGSDRVPYGQALALKELSAEAPMSGAPIASAAVNAPQRARRNQQPAQAAPQPNPVPQEPMTPGASYGQWAAQTWAEIASTPGASDLVKQYAAQAQNGG